MSEEKRPRRDWESAIEKQIREAMERGEFDNLPGVGKPLNLDENPYAPDEWRLALSAQGCGCCTRVDRTGQGNS